MSRVSPWARVATLAIAGACIVAEASNAGGESSPAEVISRSAMLTIATSPGEAFALLGPIEEARWAHGWAPRIVSSESGLVTERMVFQTTPRDEREQTSTWIVSKYLPEHRHLEYTVFTTERVWWIDIRCVAGATPATTQATVCYSCLPLTAAGTGLCRKALDRVFVHDLEDWEAAINHYLRTAAAAPEGHHRH